MPIKKRAISNRQKENRQCSNDDILELFRKSIKDDSVFIRLTAIIQTTLEQNISFEAALNLKTVIGNRLLKTGQLMLSFLGCPLNRNFATRLDAVPQIKVDQILIRYSSIF